MDKLTINELKGYLGTGLTVSIQSELYPNPQVIGIVRDVVYLNYHGSSLSMNIDKIKPYLHPLSSLTEYREDLGFVPIEELAKISDTDYLETIECKSKGNVFGLMYFDENGIKMVFNYSSETKSFASFERFSKKTFIVYKQLELFQKLYSWHIDLHGLIDRNLAINLKTLKDG